MVEGKKKKAKPEGEARPSTITALYGDAGSRKSTMAATYPLPQTVCFFDAVGKDQPYIREYKRQGLTRGKTFRGQEDQRIQPWLDSEGQIRACVEFYDEPDPEEPWAVDAFRRRMRRFVAEGEMAQLIKNRGTLIIDSASGLIDAAYNHQRYAVNKGDEDLKGLAWAKAVTTEIERLLIRGVPYFRCNVVACFHIEVEKVKMQVGANRGGPPPVTHPTEKGLAEYQDQYMRSLAVPGRIRRTNAIFAKYAESYRLYVNDRGEVEVQTQTRDEYIACTQINAPDRCKPHYDALWANYEG